jgi:hypothetical protein
MTNNSVLAAAVLLGFSSTSLAGVTFTQVTTVDGKKTSVSKVFADGDKAKVEVVEAADNPFMPPGSYMLFADGETLLVNPAARTYSRFDASMFEGMNAMAGQMQITDPKFDKTVDERGETIEGYPTRHYQFKSSWNMSMQGMPMKTESSTVEDLWTTTALEVPAMPMGPSAGGMPSEMAKLVENQGLRQVEGVPLRHITVQSTKMSMGAMPGLGGLGAALGGLGGAGGAGGPGGGDTKTTIEATDIEEVAVPAATFALPDGYRETQLFQTGPAVPSLNGVQEAPPRVPSLNNLN